MFFKNKELEELQKRERERLFEPPVKSYTVTENVFVYDENERVIEQYEIAEYSLGVGGRGEYYDHKESLERYEYEDNCLISETSYIYYEEAGGMTPYSRKLYEYDNNKKLKKKIEQKHDGGNGIWINQLHKNYIYDCEGMLSRKTIEFVDSEDVGRETIYEYDGAGRRTKKIILAGGEVEYDRVKIQLKDDVFVYKYQDNDLLEALEHWYGENVFKERIEFGYDSENHCVEEKYYTSTELWQHILMSYVDGKIVSSVLESFGRVCVDINHHENFSMLMEKSRNTSTMDSLALAHQKRHKKLLGALINGLNNPKKDPEDKKLEDHQK